MGRKFSTQKKVICDHHLNEETEGADKESKEIDEACC